MRFVIIPSSLKIEMKIGDKEKYFGVGCAVFEHMRAFFVDVDGLSRYFKPFTGSVKYLVRLFLMSPVIILAVKA